MPIVTLTENEKTTYYAVTDGKEAGPEALVEEFKLGGHGHATREYAEHALQKEYLRRLTEHAYECVQLAHLTLNPPDDEADLIAMLKTRERLAEKIQKSAVWLRTFDPFTGLVADSKGNGIEVDGKAHHSYDDDSWEATEGALHYRDPWWRDEQLRREKEKAEKEAALKASPEYKRQKRAIAGVVAAFTRKQSKRTLQKAAEIVANKAARRAKRRAA